MTEYIERGKILEKAWDADTRAGFIQVVDVGEIENAPAIDVVPVVRCKDCKFYHIETLEDNEIAYYCGFWRYEIDGDDYCSYGTRKDGVTDG